MTYGINNINKRGVQHHDSLLASIQCRAVQCSCTVNSCMLISNGAMQSSQRSQKVEMRVVALPI